VRMVCELKKNHFSEKHKTKNSRVTAAKCFGWLAMHHACNAQKKTPLLTHCTNMCPVIFIGLDDSDLKSGVKVRM